MVALVAIFVRDQHDVGRPYWIVFHCRYGSGDEVVFDLFEVDIAILPIRPTTTVSAGNDSSAISATILLQPLRESLVRLGSGELGEAVTRHLSTSWGNWSVGFDSHGGGGRNGKKGRSGGKGLFIQFGEVDFLGFFFEGDAGNFRRCALGMNARTLQFADLLEPIEGIYIGDFYCEEIFHFFFYLVFRRIGGYHEGPEAFVLAFEALFGGNGFFDNESHEEGGRV